MRIAINFRILAPVMAIALTFFACEPAGPTENIVQVASGNESVSTLVKAVQAGGLVETLEGEGPFTVFAPTNAAFEALPDGLLDALLKPENKEILATILKFHVASGKLMASDVLSAIEGADGSYAVKTVQGGELQASLDGESVVLTDSKGTKATVTATDVAASNGVIHLIDAVVLPSSIDPAALLPKPDIVGVASGNDDFGTLVAAVKAAGLVETLQGEGPFTVFAPTNAAFGKLPNGTVERLLKPEAKDQLTAILTYHVVAGKVDAATLIKAIQDNDGSYTVETVQGGTLTAAIEGGKVVLTDGKGGKSTVVATDVEASNGLIHVIDSVVLPKG